MRVQNIMTPQCCLKVVNTEFRNQRLAWEVA